MKYKILQELLKGPVTQDELYSMPVAAERLKEYSKAINFIGHIRTGRIPKFSVGVKGKQ